MTTLWTQISKVFADGHVELETKAYEGNTYAEAFSSASSAFFYDMWYATSNTDIVKIVGKIVNVNLAVEGNMNIVWERPIVDVPVDDVLEVEE